MVENRIMSCKWRHYTIIIVTIVLFGLLYCININYKFYVINHQRDKITSKHMVSIMTYNIAAYDSIRFTTEKQERLIDLIKQEKPDIVCFQEMSFESLKKIKPQLDSLYGPCEILKGDDQMWRLKFYSHFPLRNYRRYRCRGYIDTTKMTTEERVKIEFSQKQMGVMSAEFEIEPGRWITIFSGQLRSSAYSTARRSMDKDDSWFKGLSLYWRNYKIGKRIRDYEAQNVRAFVDEERAKGNPVIVAGDLNDWSGSDCLNTLVGKDLKDAWSEHGRGFGWTYFGWNLRLRLDHILYSEELELTDVNVIDSDLSDHKPLMARFRMK